MRTKYIVLKKGSSEMPYLFSELDTHSEVARALGGKVVGAGFCWINDNGQYECYGESISCNVKSRKEVDSKVLNDLLTG